MWVQAKNYGPFTDKKKKKNKEGKHFFTALHMLVKNPNALCVLIIV